ncbi:hypothetical protein F2P56_003219 [Juglans regia]|uniref:Protein MHF1 homolog isoform X1 n=4 Tax=Juglans regia TaxID=51240 RepID=A0A2I4FMV1_JUGRE|nr:protein MHF1 homolog isoform X1 [Juglans regia]KAF5476466.1 hypothetical protein F2P56_003219 [Juglans regia]
MGSIWDALLKAILYSVNPCDRREQLRFKPSHSVCISRSRRAKLEHYFVMEADGAGSDVEREDESVIELLRDRFRLLTISIAEAQAKRNDLEISLPIAACIADLAFKYTEQLAKDLELFAQHASRKSINMEDVILSAHRNEHLATSLRSFGTDLKSKEAQSERKRKKPSRKEDKATTSVVHIPDN